MKYADVVAGVGLCLVILGVGLSGGPAIAADNIDPDNDGSRFAWGENVGWINAQPLGSGGPGVLVEDDGLSGYLWGENTGWISLSCLNTASCGLLNYGVANDGNGNLSGFGWGENIGWVHFSPATGGGVIIDPATGEFSGRAWSGNVGWITFRNETGAVVFGVTTAWRGSGAPVCTPASDPDLNGDTVVNILDVSTVSSCFGLDPNGNPQCHTADVDCDLDVDMNDINFVVGSFGQTGFPSDQNTPPVADAGPDQTVLLTGASTGASVTLDGSGSSDADGNPLTFAWSLTSVPAGSTAALSEPTLVNPTFVADVAGAYGAQLIVNDGTVNSVPDTATVTVVGITANTTPVVTITAPPDGATFPEGTAITFAGTALDAEDGELTASLAWSSDVDGPLGPGGTIMAALSVGTHIVTASATDASGATGSASITVTVAANTAPEVTVTAPPDGAAFPEGTAITFAGTALDAEDGELTADLAWSSDVDGPLGPGETIAAALSVGTHVVTASATDASGATGSASITVTTVIPTIQTIAGKAASPGGFSGDGGPAIAADLLFPRKGLVIGPDGNLIFSDTGNHRVRRIDLATGIITTIAGNGQSAFSGDGGLATNAGVTFPLGLALDGNRLLIADGTDGRIRAVDLATGIIDTIAGNGGFFIPALPADPVTTPLSVPEDVAVTSAGDVLIVDSGLNTVIWHISAITGLIDIIAGTLQFPIRSGDGGPASNATFQFPASLALDDGDNIFILDKFVPAGPAQVLGKPDVIRRIDAVTGIIETVAGGGTSQVGSGPAPALDADLAGVNDLTWDAVTKTFLLTREGNRVLRFAPQAGTVEAVAGNGTFGFSGDGGDPLLAQLANPEGTAVDAAGNFFIAERAAHRIRRVGID